MFSVSKALLGSSVHVSGGAVSVISDLRGGKRLFCVTSNHLLSSTESCSRVLNGGVKAVTTGNDICALKGRVIGGELGSRTISTVFRTYGVCPRLRLQLFSASATCNVNRVLRTFVGLTSGAGFGGVGSGTSLGHLSPFVAGNVLYTGSLSILTSTGRFLGSTPSLYLSSSDRRGVRLVPSKHSGTTTLGSITRGCNVGPRGAVTFNGNRGSLPVLVRDKRKITVTGDPERILRRTSIIAGSGGRSKVCTFLSGCFTRSLRSWFGFRLYLQSYLSFGSAVYVMEYFTSHSQCRSTGAP